MSYKVDFVLYTKEYFSKFYKTDRTADDLIQYFSDLLYKENGFKIEDYPEPLDWNNVRLIRVTKNDGSEPIEKRLPFNPERKLKAIEMLGGKCVKCGSTDNLEFDHIDPDTKSFNIASNWSRAQEDLDAELAKCQLLCDKCHDEKSASERTGYTCGTIYAYRTKGCRCYECKEAKKRSRKPKKIEG